MTPLLCTYTIPSGTQQGNVCFVCTKDDVQGGCEEMQICLLKEIRIHTYRCHIYTYTYYIGISFTSITLLYSGYIYDSAYIGCTKRLSRRIIVNIHCI